MITKTLQTWIDRYNLSDDFLSAKLSGLSDQSLILDRDVVIDRVCREIKTGGVIAIASDYDCDGLGAGVILVDAIRKLGGRATLVTASRFGGGGYGFSTEVLDRVLALSPSLVLTADCGSSDHDRLERLKSVGVDALVIDHHLVPDRPLPVLGFLNPHRPECKSEFKEMCSAGLAWSVMGGVNKKLGGSLNMRSYLDIVCISTIADVVSLTGDNRAMVKAGLDVLSKGERPGIRALLNIAKIPVNTVLGGRDIGFRISPLVNAPGRLQSPQVIADLLLSRDAEEAASYSTVIEELTTKRRLITEVITEECVKDIEANGYAKHNSIVLFSEHWGHGIVGIVAARIVDRYGKPTAVIGSEGRGSLRGPPGSRLYDALVYSKDMLVKYGGHQAASGVQVTPEMLPKFREKFNEFFSPATYVPLQAATTPDPLPLDPSDNFIQVCDGLNKFIEPCGQGNPRPVLSISGKVKSCKSVKGNHLKLEVSLPKNKTMGCFAISKGDLENTLAPGTQVTVTGDLRKNEWRGKVTAEMFVQDIIL